MEPYIHPDQGSGASEFCQAMKKTKVRTADGGIRLVHAPGLYGPENQLEAFSTRANASREASLRNTSEIWSAFLDIRSPLVISGFPSAESQMFDFVCTELGIDYIRDYDVLAAEIRARGHDGIAFGNMDEIDRVLWWPMQESGAGVYPQLTRPGCKNRDPWQISDDDWTGPTQISELFGIDGRSEDDFEYLFDTLENEGADLPVMVRAPDGTEVRWLNDWENPEATMGLFDPDGNACGFYMGGQIWIDEEARGHGRSALMIITAADLLGGPPAQNEDGMGFSRAGYNAHISAYWKMMETARENGFIEDENEFSVDHDNEEIEP